MSASEILDEMLAAMPESYQKTIGFPTYDLLAAVSLRMEGTDEAIDEARQQLDPENLHDSALDRYIYPRSGLERKAATFAHGSLTVTGTGTVEQGTLFESGGGVQFYATETVAIEGEGTVPVTCTVDGTAGNLPAHSVTQMPVTMQGIASCDNPEPIGGGYAEESDSEYYARYLVVLRTPATSGNIYHYVQWALEVAGVGHVKVFPRVQGVNTVDVVIADNAGQPASPALVKSVQDYIDPGSEGAGRGQAPIGAQCFVTAATGKAITVSCTVSKSDTVTEDILTSGIKESVAAYLAKRLGNRAKYLAGTSIFDYMKSEYNAGHHAGFIHAINCPDIPNGEKDWGYNVFFFHGEHYVAYALRSYPSIPDVGYVRFADSNGWVADWQKIAAADTPEVHDFPLANGFTGDLIYYKTQENICTVSGCIYGTFTKDSYISIGYLPEGFHSAHALELPVAASYGVGARCSVATDGNVTVIISTSGVPMCI